MMIGSKTFKEIAEKYAIHHFDSLYKDVENHFKAGVKWQQKRSYSEEDIKIAFTEGHNSARLRGSYKFNGTFEEDWLLWFEQFKKK